MATTRIYDGKGLPSAFAKKTAASTTLYVRTTGNDANVGTLASPLLTIQEAVNRVPEFLESPFTIDVGIGSFAGFTVRNKECNGDGYITITGKMKTATVATGTATGTSDGGTTKTLIHSAQTWTTDDLKGKWVNVAGVDVLPIVANNATTITIASDAGISLSGKAYTIQDNDTTIALADYAYFINNNGGVNASVEVNQVKVTGTGKFFYICRGVGTMALLYCRFETTSPTLALYPQTLLFWNNIVTGSTSYGLRCISAENIDIRNSFFYSNGSSTAGAGVNLHNVKGFILDGTVTSQGTTGNGVNITKSCGTLGYFTASSNAGSGVFIDNNSRVRDEASAGYATCKIHGTGNTRFGVSMGKDSTLIVKGETDITGTLGDYSFNNSFARTWATDFVSNGDIVVAEDTFSRVERVD